MAKLTFPQLHIVPHIEISRQLLRALAVSQGFALIWWLFGLWLHSMNPIIVDVWRDQFHVFRPSTHHLADPYQIQGYVNPPWLALLLAPFHLLPFELSILVQIALYYAIITAVILKFEGKMRHVVLTLSSFVAMDAANQLSVDWLACIGLLLPLTYSGPFLLLKPQLALGYYFAYRPRDWIRVGIVSSVVLGISFLIWGLWPEHVINTVGDMSIGRIQNIAPLHLLPAPLSLLIGAIMGGVAYQKRDPALGIIAWVFFTPYITLYSLLLALAMLTLRWWRATVIIWIVTWVVYGGVMAHTLLS